MGWLLLPITCYPGSIRVTRSERICITVSAQYTLQGTWVRVPIQLLHNKSKYRSFFTSKHEILDVGLRLDARKLVVQSVSVIYTGPNFSANRYGCLTKVH